MQFFKQFNLECMGPLTKRNALGFPPMPSLFSYDSQDELVAFF